MEKLAGGEKERLDRAYTLSGTRPPHAAVRGGSVPAVRWLLEQGVDKNPLWRPSKDFPSGHAPLMLALSHARTDAALLLIEEGANVDLSGIGGYYPIHAVIDWGRDPEILSALVAHGADLTLRYEGKTAMDLAQASNSRYREQYLRILAAAEQGAKAESPTGD
jgi:ankyrin repeat protein